MCLSVPWSLTPGSEARCCRMLKDISSFPDPISYTLTRPGQMWLLYWMLRESCQTMSIMAPFSWAQSMEKFHLSYYHISSGYSIHSRKEKKKTKLILVLGVREKCLWILKSFKYNIYVELWKTCAMLFIYLNQPLGFINQACKVC